MDRKIQPGEDDPDPYPNNISQEQAQLRVPDAVDPANPDPPPLSVRIGGGDENGDHEDEKDTDSEEGKCRTNQ